VKFIPIAAQPYNFGVRGAPLSRRRRVQGSEVCVVYDFSLGVMLLDLLLGLQGVKFSMTKGQV
jgi:hypothetical protein